VRKQFKTRHGALDIRIFERVGIVLFHAGDLVDPFVCFKHVDYEPVVGAMVDRVSSQPVTWHAVKRNPLEAPAKALPRTEEAWFELFDRFLVEMKIFPLRQIDITEKDEGGSVDSAGADQRSVFGRTYRCPVGRSLRVRTVRQLD
jgi:hypothetical protein